MSTRGRILLVSYYFPPVGGGGVSRPLLAARALAEAGFTPLVLTVDGAAWAHDPSRLADVPRAAQVLRLPNPDWGRVAAWAGRHSAPGRARTEWGDGRGRLRRWLVPDLHVGWSALAAAAAAALASVRAVDAVFTTSPPYSATAAGFVARALGVPWIADFRDGWTCCPTRADLPPRRIAIERRLEDVVLRRADRVLFASEAVRVRCTARVPGLATRSESVLTGYDARASAGPAGEAPPAGRLEIVHAGSILGARRETTCDRFLAALRELFVREPAARGRVRVRFLGAEPAAASRIAASGLGEQASCEPAVPRAELRATLRQAHLCLALQPPGPRGGDPIPGKLFDAAAAARPMLALAPRGALADLVGRLRLGAVCDPEDGEAVVRSLSVALRRARRGEPAFPFDPAGAEQLSSDRFAARLVAACEELIPGKGTPCPSPSAS